MPTIRRHLLAVAILLMAAQGTGFLVPTGACTCPRMPGGVECGCCKSKKDSGVDCPMCRKARHDDHSTSRCSGRCGSHDAAVPWLVEIAAILPARPMPPVPPALAPAAPVDAEVVRDVLRPPPCPPPKDTLS